MTEGDRRAEPAASSLPGHGWPIERQALDPLRIAALLADADWPGPEPVVLATTESTNADAARMAAAGAPEGACVVADAQTAGRGRLGRTWASPPHAGLWMSVVVRADDQPPTRLSWLPLAAGLAARDGIRALGRVPIVLKWPNDLMVPNAACGGSSGMGKLGGVLCEMQPDGAVVVGIGINVTLTSSELPVPTATSLLLEAGPVDREALLVGILGALRGRLAQWRAEDPSLATDYRAACVTIGRLIDVDLPGEYRVHGTVTGVDDQGHLVVDTQGISRTVTAGDVIHATI